MEATWLVLRQDESADVSALACQQDARFRGTQTLRSVTKCDANEKVSLVQAGGIRRLPSDGNMRHRPRTDRTGQTRKMMSYARSRGALKKIASFSLRDERANAKTGGALAVNFKA